MINTWGLSLLHDLEPFYAFLIFKDLSAPGCGALMFSLDWSKDKLWSASPKASKNIALGQVRPGWKETIDMQKTHGKHQLFKNSVASVLLWPRCLGLSSFSPKSVSPVSPASSRPSPGYSKAPCSEVVAQGPWLFPVTSIQHRRWCWFQTTKKGKRWKTIHVECL